MEAIRRAYHTDGTLPKRGEILVFGSNTAGVHGAGAAKVAYHLFGAQMGHAEGLLGQSYGIPTRVYRGRTSLATLDLSDIVENIKRFCNFTHEHSELSWWVTGVACGYAGYNASQIAPHFKMAINCSFPLNWREHLEPTFKQTNFGNFPMVGASDEY